MDAQRPVGIVGWMVVVGMLRTWFLHRLHEKMRTGEVGPVTRRMAMIGSEKALIRSGLREGSQVWGVRKHIDVSPGRGAHVCPKEVTCYELREAKARTIFE